METTGVQCDNDNQVKLYATFQKFYMTSCVSNWFFCDDILPSHKFWPRFVFCDFVSPVVTQFILKGPLKQQCSKLTHVPKNNNDYHKLCHSSTQGGHFVIIYYLRLQLRVTSGYGLTFYQKTLFVSGTIVFIKLFKASEQIHFYLT